jgi:Lar family restriction alleviation protein
MTDKLKPCPFCGSENISSGEVHGTHPNGYSFKQTGCLDCGSLGPEVKEKTTYAESDDKADKAWNRRVK